MYVPSHFREDDLTVLHEQIRRSRLATLVSHGADGVQASHVPMLLDAGAGPYGTLVCHLARANPHWRSLGEDEVLVVFRGEDAYVSPSWYTAKREAGTVVPTWNYVAVHAWGVPRVIEDEDELRAIVSRLADVHEAKQPRPWSVADAPQQYITAMLRGIVGIAIPIARIQGKWKLDQDETDVDLRGAVDGLRASGDPRDRATADAMEACAAKREPPKDA